MRTNLVVTNLTYPEVVERVFEGSDRLKSWSKIMRIFVELTTFSTFLIGSINYIFVAATMQEIVNCLFKLDWDIRVFIFIACIPVSLIVQIRELKHLVSLSFLSNLFVLFAFSITFYYLVSAPLELTEQSMAVSSSSELSVAVTTILFSINNMRCAFAVESKMENPQRFFGWFGVLSVAHYVVALLYIMIGFFGYLRYGEDIEPSVILNLPMDDPLAVSVKILIGIAVLPSFAFIFYVCMESLRMKIKEFVIGKAWRNLDEILIRFLMAFLMALLAALVPNLKIFISIFGTVCSSTITIFIPILVETIYLFPNGYGALKWKLWINFYLFIFYILVLIGGSYNNVLAVIDLYS